MDLTLQIGIYKDLMFHSIVFEYDLYKAYQSAAEFTSHADSGRRIIVKGQNRKNHNPLNSGWFCERTQQAALDNENQSSLIIVENIHNQTCHFSKKMQYICILIYINISAKFR
jgi:hypothetical protein